MSRSGYSEDCDGWALIRWRGAVTSAVRGKRGQAFLRELLAAMDALPTRALIAHELQAGADFCALGTVGHARGYDMTDVDPEDRESVAAMFGIPDALAAEIMFENDEWASYWREETPEQRFGRMRQWVESLLTPPTASGLSATARSDEKDES